MNFWEKTSIPLNTTHPVGTLRYQIDAQITLDRYVSDRYKSHFGSSVELQCSHLQSEALGKPIQTDVPIAAHAIAWEPLCYHRLYVWEIS